MIWNYTSMQQKKIHEWRSLDLLHYVNPWCVPTLVPLCAVFFLHDYKFRVFGFITARFLTLYYWYFQWDNYLLQKAVKHPMITASLALYPLYAVSPLPLYSVLTTESVFRHWQMFLGGKMVLSWEPLSYRMRMYYGKTEEEERGHF